MMTAWLKTSLPILLLASFIAPRLAASPGFSIENDRFLVDGTPFQIISGAIHYFRIHPDLWLDRLIRCKSLGLNTVEIYVPWNLHEPQPGQFDWAGAADIDRFITLAEELGLMVLVRAGPYICAEWEFGGFPSWLASSAVEGGGTMKLRSSDPTYLAHVDRWWEALFPRLRPRLRSNGGPILMLQIENEYGFCGKDKAYLRYLAATAKRLLGQDVLLYTTDPPTVAAEGSLPGDEVLTTVDFGPGWFFPSMYYAAQRLQNAPGKSPPMDSEFYTGWLTHWGEAMANTSAIALATDTDVLLRWANNSGNLNFYMIHGGTNFGFWAGANVESDGTYMPTITSYDYSSPISEAGDYCQPGIGGACKFAAVRAVIAAYLGKELPPAPPPPVIRAYGAVEMHPVGPLMAAAGPAVISEVPFPMEEYGQKWGLITYRHRLTASLLSEGDALLDLGLDVHDYATVLVNGAQVGTLQRSGPASIVIPAAAGEGGDITLDIVVQAMGRQNFGCDAFGAWDRKGLISPEVRLNGHPLRSWEVYNYDFEDLSRVPQAPAHSAAKGDGISTVRRLSHSKGLPDMPPNRYPGPTFYRGTLHIEGANAELVTDSGNATHLACAYLDTTGWGKGIAWVNGFNLGWYWPSRGPQMTLYVPGPILKPGDNEVIFLEVEKGSHQESIVATFSNQANFFGPKGIGQPAIIGAPGPRA